ncbi:hypothetical protein MHLP_03390 [Candidatus Mycoplasma haematolamae str. Purdue]|uniref:Uncharacterized protein n=1 Tax=Mycoplasma haematolamae (strain Purdue) TaxID=1212765 RepID=I7BK55_MYCHA|nr:hypothetical protein [Candidatus Mycoplasma haematolamae]AFO52258.1 hypothetical protein MHLP_03390 [Candidatus Mycoplasma haematolamae str. Purdue]
MAVFLTGKAQLGVALASLGGANAAAITVFKEPIKDLFLHQDSLDLVNGGNVEGSNPSLSLNTRVRRGIEEAKVSSSLEAPALKLQSPTSAVDLEGLNRDSGDSGLSSQIASFQGEVAKELQVLKIEEEKKVKVDEALRDFREKERDFYVAVQKVRDFLKDDVHTPVKGLSLAEREALARGYKVFAAIKTVEKNTSAKLSELGYEPIPTASDTWKTDLEARNLLLGINWRSSAIRFLGSSGSSKSNNWGFKSWNENPWRHFFSSEEDWRKTWENRDAIRNELFTFYGDLKDEWQGNKCYRLQTVSGEKRELCVAEMTPKLKNVYGEANLKIELLVGKQILDWMNYPLKT